LDWGDAMVNLKDLVVSALQTSTALATLLGSGQRIFFHFPDTANLATFPRLTYFELDNTGGLYADNIEYGSEIYYQIDLWSKASTTAMALEVDVIMAALGFARTASRDLNEATTTVSTQAGINHKLMQFKIDKETE
jgi:hypothetical protein